MPIMLPKNLLKIYSQASSPAKVQDFLNTLPFNFEQQEQTIRSPLSTLKAKNAHCLEGALLAASMLAFHGRPPLLMDLTARRPDDDHVLALFKDKGYWGAISKTNHGVLRYREPIYKSLRELALSYFHEYFDNKTGKKTLLSFSTAVDLRKLPKKLEWETTQKNLWELPKVLNSAKHYKFVPPGVQLRLADRVEIKSGSVLEWDKKGKRL